MAFLALVDAPLSSESMKFPVNSLLAGNLASETGSLETASSSEESCANPVLSALPWIGARRIRASRESPENKCPPRGRLPERHTRAQLGDLEEGARPRPSAGAGYPRRRRSYVRSSRAVDRAPTMSQGLYQQGLGFCRGSNEARHCTDQLPGRERLAKARPPAK